MGVFPYRLLFYFKEKPESGSFSSVGLCGLALLWKNFMALRAVVNVSLEAKKKKFKPYSFCQSLQ